MTAGMARFEAAARNAWRIWGQYAKHTICSHCAAVTYCRSRNPSGPFICLDCHDQGHRR